MRYVIPPALFTTYRMRCNAFKSGARTERRSVDLTPAHQSGTGRACRGVRSVRTLIRPRHRGRLRTPVRGRTHAKGSYSRHARLTAYRQSIVPTRAPLYSRVTDRGCSDIGASRVHACAPLYARLGRVSLERSLPSPRHRGVCGGLFGFTGMTNIRQKLPAPVVDRNPTL
jgi:hypothetical protein